MQCEVLGGGWGQSPPRNRNLQPFKLILRNQVHIRFIIPRFRIFVKASKQKVLKVRTRKLSEEEIQEEKEEK